MLRILGKIRAYSEDKSFDQKKVENAFNFAKDIYDEHDTEMDDPLRVLNELLELRPDEDTIIAILLHDIYLNFLVPDTLIKTKFGDSVFGLLLSLKKLLSLDYAENNKNSQVEILRKMFLTMAKDIRVILIWLASRLCLMEDLAQSRDEEYKLKMSTETMHVYVPIASRLGIYRLKTQLEDLAFKYLDSENYLLINEQVEKYGKMQKVAIDMVRDDLAKFLKQKGIESEVYGRVKNIYSIFRKLKRKNLESIDKLCDLFAIRVIVPARPGVNSVDYLYTVLGLIHSEWRPISSRFKDYVAVPKPNGYKSLHTVILGLTPKDLDQPVEVQIRDTDMHREAEYGIASHWIYKGGKDTKTTNIDSRIDWIKGLEQIDDFFSSDDDLLKGVSLDVFRDRIFVLTPRGEVKDLPAGSIPIDFAYSIHTDVGHHCVMAKVNSQTVSLDYELKNGDVVEIITKKEATPRLKWLSLVKSNFAKNKIKTWFSGLNHEHNLREGKILLNAQLEKFSKPPLNQSYSILKKYLGRDLTVSQRESLIEEIGKGMKLASDVAKKAYPNERLVNSDVSLIKPSKDETKTLEIGMDRQMKLENQIIVGGESGLPIKIAACCKPRYGNKIVAYVTRGNRITVHKSNCRLLDSLDGERIIMATWKGLEDKFYKHSVCIDMNVFSRLGLIHDITSVINSFDVNIIDIIIKPLGSGIYNDCFFVEFNDGCSIDILISKLSKIEGMLEISKIENY